MMTFDCRRGGRRAGILVRPCGAQTAVLRQPNIPRHDKRCLRQPAAYTRRQIDPRGQAPIRYNALDGRRETLPVFARVGHIAGTAK
jgi:hypothetical protein